MGLKLKANRDSIDFGRESRIFVSGSYYIPQVDENGVLTWVASGADMPIIDPVNVRGLPGEKGDKGDAFTYDMFSEEQLEALRGPAGEVGPMGPQGEAFTYEDFSQEQLEALRGPAGYTPVKGKDYFDGKDGSVSFEALTEAQKDEIRGADGYTPVKGVDYFDGERGLPGNSGVHIGDDMPTDEDVYMWIDTEGEVAELATVDQMNVAIAASEAKTETAIQEAINSIVIVDEVSY